MVGVNTFFLSQNWTQIWGNLSHIVELLKKCVQRSKILFFDMLLYCLISIPYEKKDNGGVPSYFF